MPSEVSQPYVRARLQIAWSWEDERYGAARLVPVTQCLVQARHACLAELRKKAHQCFRALSKARWDSLACVQLFETGTLWRMPLLSAACPRNLLAR